jgi:dihydroneopterin aldolase
MAETLHLSGIAVKGRHGASPGEQDRPQRFLVDLEVTVEPAGDDLATTADYREVVAAVRGLVAQESHELLETLARRVVEVVLRISGVRSCRAIIRKPDAAEGLDIGGVAAEAEGEP